MQVLLWGSRFGTGSFRTLRAQSRQSQQNAWCCCFVRACRCGRAAASRAVDEVSCGRIALDLRLAVFWLALLGQTHRKTADGVLHSLKGVCAQACGCVQGRLCAAAYVHNSQAFTVGELLSAHSCRARYTKSHLRARTAQKQPIQTAYLGGSGAM